MGFNNDGAEVVADRLRRLRRRGDLPIVGVNIGKSRVTAVEDAVDDYRFSARLLAPLADYLVVNVSSPNTPGSAACRSWTCSNRCSPPCSPRRVRRRCS